MPRKSELDAIKADPGRHRKYLEYRRAAHERRKAKNPAKYAAERLDYRERNKDWLNAARRLADEAEREITAADRKSQLEAALHAAEVDPMAIYNRALAILPRSVPLDIRQSYAAAALVAVMDGELPLDFDLADLQPIRFEDLPMDAHPKFIFLGGLTEHRTGLLAGLY